MTVAALRFRSVSQAYQTRDGSEIRALDGLDFSITAGEFLSIVGPSGCGKSTALRLIAGLDPVTRGEIEIDGFSIAEVRDRIGFVFQKPTLLHWLTIQKNVLLPLRIRSGKPTAGDVGKANRLLEMVGLGQFGEKYPQELSGGMQQRAAICRALIQNPDILLMDEPFGALDALTREEMCFELMRLWERSRKTIVFVTHSIPEAVLLSDRVLVMTPRPGRVADLITINIPRPRTLAHMKTQEFQEANDRIRSGIYGRDGTADRPAL